MASILSHLLNICRLTVSDRYAPVANDISVRVMLISHGQTSTQQTYDSTAFFVRHDPSGKEFLFFGDVEPDSLSAKPRNIDVWRAAARKIPHVLDTIFIECSYPTGRQDEYLYGHLSPEHLAAELLALAREVAKERNGETTQALRGVRVVVTHCKEDLSGQYREPIHLAIAAQVRGLVDSQNLGAEIIAAEQGMHISKPSFQFSLPPWLTGFSQRSEDTINNYVQLQHTYCTS